MFVGKAGFNVFPTTSYLEGTPATANRSCGAHLESNSQLTCGRWRLPPWATHWPGRCGTVWDEALHREAYVAFTVSQAQSRLRGDPVNLEPSLEMSGSWKPWVILILEWRGLNVFWSLSQSWWHFSFNHFRHLLGNAQKRWIILYACWEGFLTSHCLTHRMCVISIHWGKASWVCFFFLLWEHGKHVPCAFFFLTMSGWMS